MKLMLPEKIRHGALSGCGCLGLIYKCCPRVRDVIMLIDWLSRCSCLGVPKLWILRQSHSNQFTYEFVTQLSDKHARQTLFNCAITSGRMLLRWTGLEHRPLLSLMGVRSEMGIRHEEPHVGLPVHWLHKSDGYVVREHVWCNYKRNKAFYALGLLVQLGRWNVRLRARQVRILHPSRVCRLAARCSVDNRPPHNSLIGGGYNYFRCYCQISNRDPDHCLLTASRKLVEWAHARLVYLFYGVFRVASCWLTSLLTSCWL